MTDSNGEIIARLAALEAKVDLLKDGYATLVKWETAALIVLAGASAVLTRIP